MNIVEIQRSTCRNLYAMVSDRFYRATACNATHGIAKAFLSVRPSVRPSVCLPVFPSVCQTCQNERNLYP